MPTFLLATTSVHTAAAACDYLGGRLTAEDTVMILGVEDGDIDPRDIDDAVNVARARLVPATVWTERREGDPATEIFDLAADIDADEIVLGPHRGDPDEERSGLGSTASAVAGEAEYPVVVVPA